MGFNARSTRTVDESTLSVDVLTRYDVIWTLIKRSYIVANKIDADCRLILGARG